MRGTTTIILRLFMSILQANSSQANVTAVTTKGEENAYHFLI
ncbi:MAG: Unknown protein [uncultured Sulfurovum sp.]|uniref:Uncharacterized protein n=1 Tax=uncultured Sulfurovum sp. TaxID=269237 RepID=A0A6S6SWG6_9BACT|nr:MAG: Unknown protein [uncultured Sulfurovum sp.]